MRYLELIQELFIKKKINIKKYMLIIFIYFKK